MIFNSATPAVIDIPTGLARFLYLFSRRTRVTYMGFFFPVYSVEIATAKKETVATLGGIAEKSLRRPGGPLVAVVAAAAADTAS